MFDELTGLPVVPEGFRWKVDWETVKLPSYFPTQKTGNLRVRLEERRVDKHMKKVPKWFFFSRVLEIEDVIWFPIYLETVHGVHPIAVRNAANRIMKRWAKDKDRERLIGIYPPKKLEVQ